MRTTLSVALLILLAFASGSREPAAAPSEWSAAQRAAAGATVQTVAAARTFLESLDDRNRAKVSVPLDAKSRTVWSNLPTGTVMQVGATERNGVKLADLTAAQQEAALALVASVLSPSGYQKVLDIVNADEQLETTTAPTRAATSRVKFGRGEYSIAILGAATMAQPWMLQFGGHHLGINVTVVGQQSVLTPSHTGAQPAAYTLNGRTVRPLGRENDKAFALVNALGADQRKQAVLDYEIRDMVLGPGQDGRIIQPEGVKVSGFSADQRTMLVDLVGEWVGILNDQAAAAKMAEVKANLADTYFAWSGPTTNGSGAYFRIQGPTVLIEYAPTGQKRDTNHIHTIYRDPTNDYGQKLTR